MYKDERKTLNVPPATTQFESEEEENDIKARIGDFIYAYVEALSPTDDAPKITGMIIDGDYKDVLDRTKTFIDIKAFIKEGQILISEDLSEPDVELKS